MHYLAITYRHDFALGLLYCNEWIFRITRSKNSTRCELLTWHLLRMNSEFYTKNGLVWRILYVWTSFATSLSRGRMQYPCVLGLPLGTWFSMADSWKYSIHVARWIISCMQTRDQIFLQFSSYNHVLAHKSVWLECCYLLFPSTCQVTCKHPEITEVASAVTTELTRRALTAVANLTSHQENNFTVM